MVARTNDMPQQRDAVITDLKAEELEAKGFYRRAAFRWQEIMCDGMTEQQQNWLIKRVSECLTKLKKKPVEADSFVDVVRAARETQRRMGIAKPGGQAFRIKTKK